MPLKELKNKPVGYHEVDYMLSCGHLNAEKIEAAIFVPKINEQRTCLICKQSAVIINVGQPYWMDEDDNLD